MHTFVIRLTGPGMGRSRFVTPSGEPDPWRFHARQYDTPDEAEDALTVLKGELPAGVFAEVARYDDAWFEALSPESTTGQT